MVWGWLRVGSGNPGRGLEDHTMYDLVMTNGFQWHPSASADSASPERRTWRTGENHCSKGNQKEATRKPEGKPEGKPEASHFGGSTFRKGPGPGLSTTSWNQGFGESPKLGSWPLPVQLPPGHGPKASASRDANRRAVSWLSEASHRGSTGYVGVLSKRRGSHFGVGAPPVLGTYFSGWTKISLGVRFGF